MGTNNEFDGQARGKRVYSKGRAAESDSRGRAIGVSFTCALARLLQEAGGDNDAVAVVGPEIEGTTVWRA